MARSDTKSSSTDVGVLVAQADPPPSGSGAGSDPGSDGGSGGSGASGGGTRATAASTATPAAADDAADGAGRRARRWAGRFGRDDAPEVAVPAQSRAAARGAAPATKGAAKATTKIAAAPRGGRGVQGPPDTPARPAVPAPPLTPQELLRAWTYSVRVRAEAHGAAASRYLVAARGAAALAAVLAAGVGGSLATVATGTRAHPLLTLGLAAASAVAAVLGVVLIAFDLPDRATKHRHAAIEHTALFHRLEQLESGSKSGPNQGDLEGFRAAWTTVEAVAPVLGRRRLARARRTIAKQDR